MPPFPILMESFTGSTNPASPAYVGQATIPKPILPSYGTPTPTAQNLLGAGQGPIPATGQLADQPFSNVFNFQLPTPSTDTGTSAVPMAGGGGGGYGQYIPLIIVGVIVAAIGWVAFGK